MELVVNEKSRYRIFRNRQKGLKKKIHALSTLCDVKACMILYGPNAHGTESSQPDIWPENRNEVEGIIENYRKERKKDHGKRTLDLSDVLQTKKKTNLELREVQEKNVKTKTGVDEFSYEQLMEIIDKLDKKHEAVQNMIDSKKGKARLMSETTVGCSNIKVPVDCQGTGVVESDLGFMMNQMGMVVENHQYAELGATTTKIVYGVTIYGTYGLGLSIE
uniref:MADS-box domain-containing protein n=1 Tax=Vitis vinifera TaxID=29760 RepID=F6GVF7_VITVI